MVKTFYARVTQASKKIAERRLNWYGRVMRRGEEQIVRKVLRTYIPGEHEERRKENKMRDNEN